MAEVAVLRVRLLSTIQGTRNGQDWPPVGGVIELPADEATSLLNANLVELAEGGKTTESAAVDTKPRKRTSGLTKGNTGL